MRDQTYKSFLRKQYDVSNGKLFEEESYNAIHSAMTQYVVQKTSQGKKYQKDFNPGTFRCYTGSDIDTKFGTDYVWKAEGTLIRIDMTLAYSEKEFMPFEYQSDIEIANGYPLKFGVRHGNTYKQPGSKVHYSEFLNSHGQPVPVVVVGVDMDDTTFRRNLYQDKNIFDVINEYAFDILSTAKMINDEFKAGKHEKDDEILLTARRTNDPDVTPYMSKTMRRLIRIAKESDQNNKEAEHGQESLYPDT